MFLAVCEIFQWYGILLSCLSFIKAIFILALLKSILTFSPCKSIIVCFQFVYCVKTALTWIDLFLTLKFLFLVATNPISLKFMKVSFTITNSTQAIDGYFHFTFTADYSLIVATSSVAVMITVALISAAIKVVKKEGKEVKTEQEVKESAYKWHQNYALRTLGSIGNVTSLIWKCIWYWLVLK